MLPSVEGLDTKGLEITEEALKHLLTVDKDEWKAEAADMEKYFKIFGDRLPKGVQDEFNNLEKRLS